MLTNINYSFVGLFFLTYSLLYIAIRLVVINDFSKRTFIDEKEKQNWRKQIYKFGNSHIGIFKYFYQFKIK